MRVLGIDPGSETLGWGVVEGSGSRYSAVDFNPDVVSVEDAFYSVNVKVAMKLGQVRGVVLLLAEQRSLEIAEYAPRLIKQTVVGHGNAEKHQVGEMVKILLRLKSVPTPHDAADALAIAICHFHHAGAANRLRAAKR
jgi:crossover junction endodeoxyribonuclease RuvC